MEADGAVDAQNAPTVPWKTLCVFHELPQGLSNQITHEKPRKAPKWRWETRIDPGICQTCACRLEKGEVDYVLEPLELPDPGSVLICCSKPKADRVVLGI